MKHQFRSLLILSIALIGGLSCQISNVIGAGPIAMLPTEPSVQVQSTNIPPTLVVAPPTIRLRTMALFQA
jgi:hypothetical protein